MIDREGAVRAPLGVRGVGAEGRREGALGQRFRAGAAAGRFGEREFIAGFGRRFVDGPPSSPGGTEPSAVDHGVICDVVAFGPQVGGLVSGARGPSLKSRVKELNGTCGFSAKVVVSCPVCGSALTLPTKRTEMP